uniref:Uncharacterized protein n=1 Tax=Glossina brevipalpis TaxID=37001 RepID=A0A1A9W8X2_9MUSC
MLAVSQVSDVNVVVVVVVVLYRYVNPFATGGFFIRQPVCAAQRLKLSTYGGHLVQQSIRHLQRLVPSTDGKNQLWSEQKISSRLRMCCNRTHLHSHSKLQFNVTESL